VRNIPYRQIALVVVVIVVLAVVIPMAVFAVPQVVGADDSYVVVSSSMEPTFDAGAVVIVNSVSPESIQQGDIVTYREGEKEVIKDGKVNRITHRVVGVSESEGAPVFTTKGDANDAPDPQPVPASAVIGQVAFSIPYLGHLIAFMTTDLGYAVFIGVPIGLLVLGEVYDLAIAARNTRREANETTDAESVGDADEPVAENGAAPATDPEGPLTGIAPPSGFDPGVSVAGNGTPVDARDNRAEPTDPTSGDENGGIEDA